MACVLEWADGRRSEGLVPRPPPKVVEVPVAWPPNGYVTAKFNLERATSRVAFYREAT